MSQIFIIHGAYGDPEENWFPWLKEELEDKGHEVSVPEFPTPENQELEVWKERFQPYMEKIGGNTVFVGHSLGPAFILSILEDLELEEPIRACFFVSGFVGKLGIPKFDRINRSFVDKDFNWERIRKNCKSFYIFHSKDDPYVPLEKAEELAKKLDAGLELIDGAGHFNEESGYTEFKSLLDKINTTIV
ncbi:MAG: alpha/beta hydrolase [Candidatus Nanohaloarchaea archaeon]|nr:alpha/beta hydrolase [Candidatus Nanohaloarchaea archaeon]